jgi:hypothetical protein
MSSMRECQDVSEGIGLVHEVANDLDAPDHDLKIRYWQIDRNPPLRPAV